MKKRIAVKIFLLAVMILSYFFPPLKEVLSLSWNTSLCSLNEYALVDFYSSGQPHLISCYVGDAGYNEAWTLMMDKEANEFYTPSIMKNNRIIATKYGVFNLKNITGTTNLYVNGNTYTYISGTESSDAAYIRSNQISDSSEIMISGLTAWINRQSYSDVQDIVPINIAKSVSYYNVSNNGELIHHVANNIEVANSYRGLGINLGPAPSFLEVGKKYYSYNGHYFYENFQSMIDDYRENGAARSVNNWKPYYNYYQYLPYHSKSTYTATVFDNYIESRINSGYTSQNSKMRNQGLHFYNSQEVSGVNAAITFGIAGNESAFGDSYIALNYNNIFGHSAYDSDPSSATGYGSVAFGIDYHAEKFISSGYGDVSQTDNRYYGLFLGNKMSGINVKYASDPYWGEKAAQNYYLLDKENGLQDYNLYQLGIKISGTKVPLYTSANTNSGISYYMSSNNALNGSGKEVAEMSVLVTGADNNFYKVVSDSKTNSSGLAISDPINAPAFSFATAEVYVSKDPIYLANQGKNGYFNPKDISTLQSNVEVYEKPKVLSLTADKNVYSDSSLNNKVSSLKKDVYLVNTQRIYNKNGNLAYYVIYDITSNLGGWISVSDISFDNPFEVYYSTGGSINIRTAPNTSDSVVMKNIINSNTPFVVISDIYGEEVNGNNTWIKIQMPEVNEFGFITVAYTNYSKQAIAPGSTITNNYTSYLYALDWIDNKLHIEGFLTINDVDNLKNSNTRYQLKLVNQLDGSIKYIDMDRWLNENEHPFTIPSANGKDYTYSWYKKDIDLNSIPQGDYSLYIVTVIGEYKAEALLSNTFHKEITRKKEVDNRGYYLRSDYKLRAMPLELFIRDDGLLSYDIPKSLHNGSAYYTNNGIDITDDGILKLKGTAYNFYESYDSNVSREVIFENTKTFAKYEFDLGATSSGDYEVATKSDDNLTKEYAWFDNSVDITSLPKGEYALMLKTNTETFSDFSELTDAFARNLNISKIVKGKTYKLKMVDQRRYRMELIIE